MKYLIPLGQLAVDRLLESIRPEMRDFAKQMMARAARSQPPSLNEVDKMTNDELDFIAAFMLGVGTAGLVSANRALKA